MCEFAKYRHVVRQLIVVVQTSDFRVEFADNFNIRVVDEFAPMYRFPFLFTVFIQFDFECMVFQQLSHPLFFWDIQHDAPAELPPRNSTFIIFNAVTVGDTNIVPQEPGEVRGMCNFRLFLGQLQFQGFR